VTDRDQNSSDSGYSIQSRRSHILNSATQTCQSMLYREIIAVCSEIRTKHTNTLWGQNLQFSNVTFLAYKVLVTTVP
jgi:hypothetical protein